MTYTHTGEITIDISPIDFIKSMSNSEKLETVNLILNNLGLEPFNIPINGQNVLDIEWFRTCTKLISNRLNISLEEEKKINKIAQKL